MFRKMLIGAAAIIAAAAFTADGASARGFGGGHGGGGFHGGGGGGFHGAAMGGSAQFRGASMNAGAFRSAAVNPGAARFAAPAAGARFAGGNQNWNGGGWRHRGGRGFGGGLALGLAGSSYYNSYASYPYDDSYYGNGYYPDQYYAGDDANYAAPDDSSCYVARRIHTRHGWRLRRVFVCG